jgi:hypothetical protein
MPGSTEELDETNERIPKRVFRRPPPKELVEEILHHCGFSEGLYDIRWFSRDELALETLEEWLPLLEPFYVPCKARRFLDNFNPARCITVIRHCIRHHGYDLQTHECVYNSKKQTMYQIQPIHSLHNLSDTDLKVSFT